MHVPHIQMEYKHDKSCVYKQDFTAWKLGSLQYGN